MRSKLYFWTFAILLTLGAAYYQRVSGPTYPKKVSYSVNDSIYQVKLPRSHNSDADCAITLDGVSGTLEATLFFRKYPVAGQWESTPFVYVENSKYKAFLPAQPAAGKLEYYIELVDLSKQDKRTLLKEDPIIIRFKGSVPGWALIPHVIAIFLAMLFSNITGIMAVYQYEGYKMHGVFTLVLILVGGLIFGPIVQYYAFGQAWTGFPFGNDFTDNKTLMAFVAWLVAVLVNRKEDRPLVSLFAALVTIVIFSIPHSFRGSELDYNTGKIVTGIIHNLLYRF